MSKCAPKFKLDLRNNAKWKNRTPIMANIIVLHSTESDDGSGENVAHYLANPAVEADCHFVVDSDGDVSRLVPTNRKAWHVAGHNNHAIGIEQVGRAAQPVGAWEEAELAHVANLLAFLSYHSHGHIPLRDARGRLGAIFGSYRGGSGVVEHISLGTVGGGHYDPGSNYPFRKVLRMARKRKRECYGSVNAYAKG